MKFDFSIIDYLNEYFAGPIWNTFYCVYHKKASLNLKGSLIFQSIT